jgi:hypothetical protein
VGAVVFQGKKVTAEIFDVRGAVGVDVTCCVDQNRGIEASV